MSHIPTTVIALLPGVMFWNPAAAIAQGTSVQAIVDSLYPATRLHPDDAGDRRSGYQIAAVAADGTPTRIVAGYTDTSDAVLRVLDRGAAGTFQVSYESPADLDMFSQECKIEVSDLAPAPAARPPAKAPAFNVFEASISDMQAAGHDGQGDQTDDVSHGIRPRGIE